MVTVSYLLHLHSVCIPESHLETAAVDSQDCEKDGLGKPGCVLCPFQWFMSQKAALQSGNTHYEPDWGLKSWGLVGGA